jgi:alpha-ketoglutarate-dependent taurine dioxygenase
MTERQGTLQARYAALIRSHMSEEGYAVVRVENEENFISVCRELGRVTQTRDIMVRPDKVEPFTGYSYKPDEVPFHTDYPLIPIVGLYCVTPDRTGGDNLLVDSRHVLKELTPHEIQHLKEVRVPLPRSQNLHPVLSETADQLPHIYWLPAFALPMLQKMAPPQAEAIQRFDRALKEYRGARKYHAIRLRAGEALWFNNYVMLHGRDELSLDSTRHQIRAFVSVDA